VGPLVTEETHKELFNLVRGLQKELSQIEALIKSHLDGSDIRVKNWEKDFESFQESMDTCKSKIDEIMDFKKAMLQNRAVAVSILSGIGWIIATVGGAFGIYMSFKK